MRISRIDSNLIEVCARDSQVTPRSVRTWRLRADPRWLTWLVKREGEASDSSTLERIEKTSVTLTPQDEVDQAARRYLLLTERCDSAVLRGDQSSVVPLLRSAGEAPWLLQTT